MSELTDSVLPFLKLVLPPLHADEAYRAQLFDAPKGAPTLWCAYLDINKLAGDLLTAGQRGNAFFSPMTFRRGGKRREQDAFRCQIVWADLDVCCDGERTHKPHHYKSLELALAAADQFALKPHAVILTGRGALLVWRLSEPVKGGDLARLVRLVRGLANKLQGDPNVALATQLLRVPGTKNFDPKHKKDGRTYPVRLHRIDPNLPRYALDDFTNAGVEEIEAKSKQHAAQMDLPLGEGKVVENPRLSARMKALLATPGHEDYPSPSEADAAVLTALLGAGLSPADAAATFAASPRDADAAERKAGHLDDYIERTLRSAQSKVEADREQAREHIESVAAASSNGDGPSAKAPPTDLLFPEAAWHGLFADYRQAMGESEAPDAHHFGAALTLVGAALGRRVFVRYRKPAYPNLYGVLVGKTGMSRKTTSMRTALDDLLLAVEPEFRYISAPGSAEGLMEQVATAGMTAAQREQYNAHIDGKPLVKDGPVPEMPRAPVEGRRLLFAPEEFALLLTKAKQEGSSSLGPVITAIYDCPNRYDPPTRKRPIIALKPTVSILTATAPAWVEKYLGASELLSGFVNRFCFFGGSPMAPIAWPKEPDQPFLNAVRQQLHRALVEWEGKEHEFELDEPARRLWDMYYAVHYSRMASYPDSHAAVVQRCPLFAVKIALIFAALRCDAPTINAADLERATLVADFLEQSALELLGDLGGDKDLELETKILKKLASGDHLKKRPLHQSVGGRFPADRFNRTVEAMVRAEIIRSDESGAYFDPAAKGEPA